MKSIYAIIVAAGRGSRFGGDLPKQYTSLGKAVVLSHTVRAFLSHPQITGVRVLIHPDDQDLYESAVEGLDLLAPAFGGKSRQESVFNGLQSVADFNPDLVLIHDAARPFVSADVIDRVIAATTSGVGIIPALPVTDTLKREAEGYCADTVDRTSLWRAQTPQGFEFQDIYPAHQQLSGKELTDDAALMEAVGKSVRFVMGHEDNFKITTQDDLVQAQRIMAEMTEFRTGSGFDVHRFCEGDHVTLCGVDVPHSEGLAGHSDADVALHAITDAVLGAIAAGDIGTHFPRPIRNGKAHHQTVFWLMLANWCEKKGGQVINLDVTIICERPKVGPYRDHMRKRVAEICDLDLDRVSVKGTTTEKLGFTGRSEGIAAQAVATVKL